MKSFNQAIVILLLCAVLLNCSTPSQQPPPPTEVETRPVVVITEQKPKDEAIITAPTVESNKLCALQNQSLISLEQACQRISNRLASVSVDLCESSLLQDSGCSSVKGFPLISREFLPLQHRVPMGKVLVIGGIHGDELTSVSTVFKWIQILNKHHSGIFHWQIVPLANPDSLLRPDAKRTNANGVDINRNFPSLDWDEKAHLYWRDKTSSNPRRFPGSNAASEPETRFLLAVMERFQPDIIISLHAPYGVVDYDALQIEHAPKNLGRLRLNLLGTYPGSLGNFAGINRNIPVITVELPHAWYMPRRSEVVSIWEDVVSWLKENVSIGGLATENQSGSQ